MAVRLLFLIGFDLGYFIRIKIGQLVQTFIDGGLKDGLGLCTEGAEYRWYIECVPNRVKRL